MTQPKCKGLIFKVIDNMYWDGKAIVEKRTLRLMKRKSCKCPSCEYVVKEFLPELGNMCYDFVSEGAVNGKLYELKYIINDDEEVDFRFEEVTYHNCKYGDSCLIRYPFVHNGGPSCPCLKLELK